MIILYHAKCKMKNEMMRALFANVIIITMNACRYEAPTTQAKKLEHKSSAFPKCHIR
jgi:hypothetical protein